MIRNTIRTTLGKEPVRPSQRSSVETPRQPAPEAPTVRCLVDQAWLAPVGRRRSWWAARTVIKRNPTRSRPRTDVGVPTEKRYQKSDDIQTTQASTAEASNWHGNVEHTYHAHDWKSRHCRVRNVQDEHWMSWFGGDAVVRKG